jgi:hypothetical protein
MAVVKTTFKSLEHGFQFINRFPFPFSVSFKLPFAGEINLGDIVYGLCGGMCFAARDYFVAGKSVPAYAKVDEIPSDFLLYLWNRQLDSLGLLVVPKVIEWMLRNDNDVGRLTAQYEIPKIRRRLDQGQPVVIALIRVQRGDDPTRNHQVLAMGYDLDDVTKRITLFLYDPNHPAQEPTISLNLAHPSLGIEPVQSTGEPLRGLFMIKYKPQTPP